MIHVVNINSEDCSDKKNFFYIGRSKDGNPLGNPFTHNGKKSSLAKLSFKTRDEAIDAYKVYFETVYNQPGYERLTRAFNEIYEHYKNGEDIYLGCFCKPLRCHGDILAEELQKKLIREQLANKKLNDDN
jgi:hypothetical protein